MSSADRGNKRQWANVNRRKSRITPTSATAASEEANRKIGELADSKKLYYESKLAIKQQQHDLFMEQHQRTATFQQQQHDLLLAEHARRMHVLGLEEKYFEIKLRKLSADE